MKITPTQRFRDGRDTYEPGEEYEVPDMDGAFFVRNGWATSPNYTPPGVEPAPAVTGIQPDSARHVTKSTEI